MQLSIAQEIGNLPLYRQQEDYKAYTEGWALYSERLGTEVGFYQDPYSYYGHLQEDMLRAIRLVVDTGLHYKHWTRQQVVDYFHAHSIEIVLFRVLQASLTNITMGCQRSHRMLVSAP
jgi:uncharacterized protein (DUF885 family)